MKFTKLLSSIIADIRNLQDIPVSLNSAPPFVNSVLSVIPRKSKFPMAGNSKITITLALEVDPSVSIGITPDGYVNGQADVFILDNSGEEPKRIEIDRWEMSIVDSTRIVLEVYGLTTWKSGYTINVGTKASKDGSSSSSESG